VIFDLSSSFVFISILAVRLAWLEIEIEGPHGWAKNTQTAEIKNGLTYWFFRFLLGGRPVTVYHVYIFSVVLLIFHAPYFYGSVWTLSRELITLAHYLVAAALWDYLWFIFNPHYGVNKFKPATIWWHNNEAWLFCRPLSYYKAWLGSVVLAYGASWLDNNYYILISHFCLMFLLLAITVNLSIKYADDYHRWYQSLRPKEK